MVQLKALRKDNKKLKSDLESAKDAEVIAHRSLGSGHPASDDDINLEPLKRVRDLERTVKGLRAVSLLHPLFWRVLLIEPTLHLGKPQAVKALRKSRFPGLHCSPIIKNSNSSKFKAKQFEAELEDLNGGPRGKKDENGEQEVDPEYRMRKVRTSPLSHA